MADDAETAYFALLRARDAVADLRRWEEYLADEARRLRRFESEGAAHAQEAPARLRRRMIHTDAPISDAIRLRLEVIAEEQRRLPERIEDAEAYVTECETLHQRARDRA